MTDMPRRALGRTGLTLTEFSFGGAGIAGLYQACPPEQAAATLQAAWASGIRSFDTAPFYGCGLSEQRLGAFLANMPRDDYVLSSKVGRLLIPTTVEDAPDYGFVGANPARVHFDYSAAGIEMSFEQSLRRLGLDRIDILYVHDIGAYAHGAVEGARHLADLLGSGVAALERLKSQGRLAAWGLGVNETEVCVQMLQESQPDVILLAGRYTLLDRSAEAELLPLCQAKGVPLVIGGVFNSGILATGAIPGARFDYAPASAEICARVDVLAAACAAKGVALPSAALRFALANPCVASVLLGNSDPHGLYQNLHAAQMPVDPTLFAPMV